MSEESAAMPDQRSDADAPALPPLGELLIAARERWNLSAADVARQLRLALRQVEALESNRFDVLPGNTFVRGFLRNYAKAVQQEPSIFLEAYERCRPPLEPRESTVATQRIDFTNKPTPRWVWYLGGMAGLLLTVPLVIYFALHDDEPFKSRVLASSAKVAPKPVHEAQLSLPTQQVLAQSAALSAASGVATTATSPVSAPNLALHFEGDAWVEIRDKAGAILFSKLSPAGSEQVVQGTPPFALVVGNAAQVRIAYNGKPVDLTPYIAVNVARLTLE